jgi:solute:Na+ symporter, SSS family
MHWIDWMIVIIPLVFLLGMAVYAKKYVRGVTDFLAAGRVAGRYVISVGDLQAGLSVLTLIALCESEYQCGMAMGLWSKLVIPLSIFMSLTGYCLYRYRQTKCLSMGQFLEIRYNRPLRIIAAFIRTVAEMITNAIGPAVAARFFIYFVGLPFTVSIFGWEISTFALVMILVLSMAMLVIWPGGRISLLVTDSIQGLMSYPIFVIFTVFVLGEISWMQDVAPVMLDRAPGESFLNPMDISSLRDFNIFALVVTITSSVLNRAAWIGNDTSNSGRNAHEQKMAGILGAWRNGFASLMLTLLALFIVTVMLSNRYSGEAREIRVDLASRVATETVANQSVRAEIIRDITAIPAAKHIIGVDKPYSRKNNPDVAYLNATKKHLQKTPEGNATFQKFRTLYYQMMAPTLLRKKLSVGVMGMFILLMAMLMLSTDDSRIFNASSTLLQDVVMPFRKKPFEPKQHLLWLRLMSVAVCIFFLVVSLFFSQIDYIMMFCSIMCALWMGAAGPIMVGGLYTRFGTTTGAFCALIFGSGTSFAGIILQRNWSSNVYPWLIKSGNITYVNTAFEKVTSICSPYVVWEMNAVKFPINSYEIYFMAMVLGVGSYIIGSLVTLRKPFNLDRMLHRGKYSNGESTENTSPWTWRNVYGKLIGIDDEYTTGDKFIAWSVFAYAVVFQFLIAFVGVVIWNWISPWPASWWSWYFYIAVVVVGIIVGSVSTVWFVIGGTIDIRRLFKDLAKRVDDPLDDGWVEGHASLVDVAQFGNDEDTDVPPEK